MFRVRKPFTASVATRGGVVSRSFTPGEVTPAEAGEELLLKRAMDFGLVEVVDDEPAPKQKKKATKADDTADAADKD